MKTYIITIVVEDDYELDSEQIHEAIDDAIPCACGKVDNSPTECSLAMIATHTFAHSDDEYVDWDAVVKGLDDE